MKKKVWEFLRVILYSLLTAVVGLGIPIIASTVLFGQNGMNQTMQNANNIIMGVVGGPLIFIMVKKYYKKYYKESENEMDLFTIKGIKKSALGLGVGVLLPLVYAGVLLLAGGKIAPNSTPISFVGEIAGILTFFGMAIFEECIFRGLLQTEISKYNKIVAVIVPSFLFACSHMSLWQNFSFIAALQILFAGILFSVIVFVSNSITCAIVAHSLYNIISVCLGIDSTSSFLVGTYPEKILNMNGEKFVSILFTIVLVIFIAAIALFYKKKGNISTKGKA